MIALTQLKRNRFVVLNTRQAITVKYYRRSKFPFHYNYVTEYTVSRNAFNYELSRWVNAGDDLPTAFSRVLADIFECHRNDTVAIVNYKY